MAGCHIDEGSLLRPNGRFALHDAIERGDDAGVAALLAAFDRQQLGSGPGIATSVEDTHQISLEEKDPLGATPLHTALLFLNVAALRRVVVAGAKLDTKCNGYPPLHIAIAMAAIPANAPSAILAIRVLLAAGVDAAALDDGGRGWLHAAAEAGVVEVATVLRADARAAGAASPDAADRSGATPLSIAAALRHAAMLHWLLGVGADPGAPCSPQGDTPAHVAAARGWREGLAALREAAAAGGGRGAALDAARNDAGLTPEEAFCPHDGGGGGGAGAGSLVLTHAACAAHQTSETTGRRCGGRGG